MLSHLGKGCPLPLKSFGAEFFDAKVLLFFATFKTTLTDFKSLVVLHIHIIYFCTVH